MHSKWINEIEGFENTFKNAYKIMKMVLLNHIERIKAMDIHFIITHLMSHN